MGWSREAEEEIVETDFSVGEEAGAHGGEVDGAMVLMDLDRVPATEGDVRAADAGEVREEALAADGAVGVWGAGVDLATLVAPQVEGDEGSAHEVGLVGEEFEGFGGLNGGGEVNGCREDAGGVAGFDWAGGGLGEDAGETCGGRTAVSC